jgi:TetR/AcrR family transcriptional regulator, cholesterol catabolism regulator
MEITADRKTQIRLAAQNMFRSKGYSATSVRDLAKEVGIEAASLYNHINSKEEILREICFNIADAFFQAIERSEAEGGSATKRMERAIEYHIEVIVSHIDASSVFFHEWKHLSEPHLTEFKQLRRKYERRFIQILDDGVKEGRFRDVDLRMTSFTIFSAMNATYDLYKPNGKIGPKEISKHIADIVIQGIHQQTS